MNFKSVDIHPPGVSLKPVISFGIYTNNHQRHINNKIFTYKKQKYNFLHIGASCLQATTTTPKINSNLYSVPRLFVCKIHKGSMTMNEN